jgi:SAM-dependent methyltransferase
MARERRRGFRKLAAVQHDLYGPPPAQRAPRVSRRAFLGLRSRRAGIEYDRATELVRAREHRALARAVAPVDGVLREFAAGDDVLELPLTAWQELDPQALPYRDCSFDAVISAFGAALAPRPRRTAAELVRVVRPGGVVAIAAWVPKGLPGRLDELLERPEGVRPPSDWGRREVMSARLGPLLDGLELRTRSVQLRFADADAFAAALQVPPGLRGECDRLLASCNNAVERVEVDARYLLGMGRRPA